MTEPLHPPASLGPGRAGVARLASPRSRAHVAVGHGRAVLGAIAWAAALALAPARAAAQVPESAPVQGWVIDAALGAPLVGVRVWTVGVEPTYTDVHGFFDLGALPAGEREIRVLDLVHAPLDTVVTFGGGHPRPRLAIEPDSARAAALESVQTRLSLDRRTGAQFHRVIERDELLGLTSEELYDRARTQIPFGGPCDVSPISGRCAGIDGPMLVVDDEIGGSRMEDLRDLRPADLWVVELYPDRRFVHAYTLDFIARAMERPALLLQARRVPR